MFCACCTAKGQALFHDRSRSLQPSAPFVLLYTIRVWRTVRASSQGDHGSCVHRPGLVTKQGVRRGRSNTRQSSGQPNSRCSPLPSFQHVSPVCFGRRRALLSHSSRIYSASVVLCARTVAGAASCLAQRPPEQPVRPIKGRTQSEQRKRRRQNLSRLRRSRKSRRSPSSAPSRTTRTELGLATRLHRLGVLERDAGGR